MICVRDIKYSQVRTMIDSWDLLTVIQMPYCHPRDGEQSVLLTVQSWLCFAVVMKADTD